MVDSNPTLADKVRGLRMEHNKQCAIDRAKLRASGWTHEDVEIACICRAADHNARVESIAAEAERLERDRDEGMHVECGLCHERRPCTPENVMAVLADHRKACPSPAEAERTPVTGEVRGMVALLTVDRDPERVDEECLKCNAMVTWEGDEPGHLCHPCSVDAMYLLARALLAAPVARLTIDPPSDDADADGRALLRLDGAIVGTVHRERISDVTRALAAPVAPVVAYRCDYPGCPWPNAPSGHDTHGYEDGSPVPVAPVTEAKASRECSSCGYCPCLCDQQ